jgi:hypothetical protein
MGNMDDKVLAPWKRWVSNEPLRDESYASDSELPAVQRVEAGSIVREVVIVRTDDGSESASVYQEDGSCAWEVAQSGVLRGSAPFPLLSGG